MKNDHLVKNKRIHLNEKKLLIDAYSKKSAVFSLSLAMQQEDKFTHHQCV